LAKSKIGRTIEALRHEEATRKNIPTAECQSVLQKETQEPVRVAYERRNRELDQQLVWRGKDEQDGGDLVVHAPPLYIQEKVHPTGIGGRSLLLKSMTLSANFGGETRPLGRTQAARPDSARTGPMNKSKERLSLAPVAVRGG